MLPRQACAEGNRNGSGMKAMMRKREARLALRLGCCAVALLAFVGFAQLLQRTHSRSSRWAARRLLQEAEENCTHRPRDVEFPDDVFTTEERRRGAMLLHVFCAVYMFYALAIICDEYFVPSLEKISENLQLSQDVAGATFMAAGSSAPELFTSLIGVFITKGDVGVGTIIGSAVFNILVIIGICGVFTYRTISLTWWPLFRDSLFYLFSVVALILVVYDGRVVWWESVLLVTMYGFYILIMKFNSRIFGIAEQHCGRPGSSCGGSDLQDDGVTADRGANGDFSSILLRKAGGESAAEAPVVMVDELLRAHPRQISFSEASMRVMITGHFCPRTRLVMASRLLINERQRLSRNSATGNGGVVAAKGVNQGGGGGSLPEAARQPPEEAGDAERAQSRSKEELVAEGNGGPVEAEEHDEQEELFSPFKIPRGRCDCIKWLVSWPLRLLLYCTVPNCVVPRWRRWFMVTFVTSTLWIAVFSYLMVWMVTIISLTLDIPDFIMGITFLAAGTSVPDCMASLIVARQGLGDMAVSNSIGSNIFDILLGLGFPWVLRTLVVDYGTAVSIKNKGLVYSVILLLASVFLTVSSVHLNHWKLDRRLGFGLLFLYAIFILCSIILNVQL
ncbi:sodium/potassium/calcium exchanger 3-like isoform X1 [Paramormyrops kingsleyae]|uniref:Sodium/potassium/calcium exchanger 3-like n=1 Tax=Paramormyrops kingsleyae TaxID=1676925 RepID=A0A3B3RPN9_9TELE|nr:sodium/potassium/calcium exchanger 3-like isoform X3 [Paramormyrops kingsleyae]